MTTLITAAKETRVFLVNESRIERGCPSTCVLFFSQELMHSQDCILKIDKIDGLPVSLGHVLYAEKSSGTETSFA